MPSTLNGRRRNSWYDLMTQWRSRSDILQEQVTQLTKQLESLIQEKESLQQQFQILKTQNERLLRMEAQHQNAKKSLLEKRIIFTRAVVLFPESTVVGDRLENCVLKIYKGCNLIISDTAELINCRIIGLDYYSEDKMAKAIRPTGTIEIRGLFYNTHPRRFAISTHERVVIHKGVRFRGNICASSILISELTKVRGRFASRELWEQKKDRKERMESLLRY